MKSTKYSTLFYFDNGKELEQNMEICTLSSRFDVGRLPFKNRIRFVRLDGYCLVGKNGRVRLNHICVLGHVDWFSKVANLSMVQEATKS